MYQHSWKIRKELMECNVIYAVGFQTSKKIKGRRRRRRRRGGAEEEGEEGKGKKEKEKQSGLKGTLPSIESRGAARSRGVSQPSNWTLLPARRVSTVPRCPRL